MFLSIINQLYQNYVKYLDNKKKHKAWETFRELLRTEEVYVRKLQAIKEIKTRMLWRVEKDNHSNQNLMKKEISEALDPPGLESITTLHT